MNTTIPAATCIANLEEIIFNLSERGELQPGQVVAYWAGSNEPITIAGRWRGRGYFPRWCVRWTSPARGIFAKGLAGYTGPEINFTKIKHLPIVK